MDEKIKKIARTGFIAKGSVYAITGVLTFKAAFDLGGERAGKLQVLNFLDQQTFGNVLLILMGIGLACYASWRFIQSISDPEHIGTDTKAKAKRGAFFLSGVLYLGLAVLAVMRVLGNSGGSSSSGSASKSSFLASQTGLVILGIVGAGIVIAGIFQFVKAYRNDYVQKFHLYSFSDLSRRNTIEKTAKFGLSARGAVFLIMGYFALKASFTSNPSQIKTTPEVFSFIRDSSYGPWLLGLVAAGFIAYAIYMLLMAKYRQFRG